MNFNERPEHRRIRRVIGIGNALTDMLVNLKTDSVLGRFKLAKGGCDMPPVRSVKQNVTPPGSALQVPRRATPSSTKRLI